MTTGSASTAPGRSPRASIGLYILSRGIAKAGSSDPQVRDLDDLMTSPDPAADVLDTREESVTARSEAQRLQGLASEVKHDRRDG